MTLKIAQVSDLHVGMGYAGPSPSSRLDDICRVADFMADRIIKENCDLVLVAGDLFKDARVFLDRASVEIAAVVKWLRRFSEAGIPVVAISGTPSHDAVAAYELLKEMQIHGVYIFTSPGVKEFYWDGLIVSVACLPGINRSTIASKEEFSKLAAHELHQLITDRVTELTLGLAAQCEQHPKILLSHITCAGADKGFEDLLQQQEPVLTKAAIEGGAFDLVCMGHIHKAQQVPGLVVPTFYSGSPERLSFNEEGITPGFLIHEFEDGRYHRSNFVETPARKYWTLDLPWSDEDPDGAVEVLGDLAFSLTTDGENMVKSPGEGAVVRVRYEVTEASAKLINQAQVTRELYRLGAFYVQGIEAKIRRTNRTQRAEKATSELKPVDALQMWGKVNQVDDKVLAELTARAEVLQQEAI
jgi:exonuclease SbcD